ncbi:MULTISPECIES: GLPGLI family protein [Chitinophagaceae]
MIKYISLFIFLFLAVCGKSQVIILGGGNKHKKVKDPEASIGTIYYDFIYISGTTHPELMKKETMVLTFGNMYSEFYSQTYKKSDSLSNVAIMNQLTVQQGATSLSFTVPPVEGSREKFLVDLKNRTVLEDRRFMQKNYLIAAKNNNVEWNIEDSTKIVGSYICQKAIGISRGRQYIAWFTTDLPYSYGPRRLFGLPGLILEAYDVTNRITYRFKSVEMNNSIQLGIPEESIICTDKEYEDMVQATKNNPNALPKSSTITISDLNSQQTNTTTKSQASKAAVIRNSINFPIDIVNN